jgi:hypothetical protein
MVSAGNGLVAGGATANLERCSRQDDSAWNQLSTGGCLNPIFPGYAIGGFGGAALNWTISNADSQAEMGGTFHNFSVNVGLFAAGSFNLAWSDQNTHQVFGQFYAPTINFSMGLGPGAGMSVSSFDTFTNPF